MVRSSDPVAAASGPTPAPITEPPADAEWLAAWLGLLFTPELGLAGIRSLLAVFDTPTAIAHASLTSLEACRIAPQAAQFLHAGKAIDLGFRELERARAGGIDIITLHDRRYPELLREIYDPPPVLYVRGAVAALDRYAIAVVGTRRPTPYGKLMAERLGRGLAQWGLAVVSGLARGIDSLAQRACVAAAGASTAVLGTGVDVIYPRENTPLAEEILAAGGALVSEFPLGSFPAPQNFPIRNRVISGLSLGVVVVEGGEYSGSRITARLALDQNRAVFAVPGQVTQRQAWLPNVLIKQGAKLVADIADIEEELPSSVRRRLQQPVATSGDAPASNESLPRAHRLILGALELGEATQVDALCDSLGDKMTAPEILAALLELELAGKIQQLPGKNYTRVE